MGAGSSSDRTQVQSLDDPRQSLDNPRRDESLGPPIEDYERDIAAKSQGLLKGRSAWNHGKETWLVDLPLVVLAINRLRTPQARRFRTASLEQSLKIMSA